MFRVEARPVSGELRLGPSPDSGAASAQEQTVVLGAGDLQRTFSMLDLWQGRVMYVHGGAEVLQDFFMFSVFSTNKKQLPVGNRLHRFHIDISPVNDAPALTLPEGNLFTVVDKSKRTVGRGCEVRTGVPVSELNVNAAQMTQLTPEVLRVSDPDSGPAELIFSCPGNGSEGGHLEDQDSPGRCVMQAR